MVASPLQTPSHSFTYYELSSNDPLIHSRPVLTCVYDEVVQLLTAGSVVFTGVVFLLTKKQKAKSLQQKLKANAKSKKSHRPSILF